MRMWLGWLCLPALVGVSVIWAGETKPTPTIAPVVPVAPAPVAVVVDWAAIFRNLQSPDAVVQEAAATDFVKAMEEPAALSKKPYFTDMKKVFAGTDAKAKDEAIKRIALIGLIQQKNVKQFPTLFNGLTGGDIKARAEQLVFLYKSLEDTLINDHVRDLIEKLGSEDAPTANKAAEELKALGGDAADELASALDDDKVQVKKSAAQLLHDMGPAAKEACNTLVFKLQDADDKLGRKLAIQTLQGLGPAAVDVADDLILRLDDEDKVVRKASYDILKSMGSAYKESTADLINYLTHDDKTVRDAAADLIASLGVDGKGGVKDLAEVIDDVPATPVPVANGAPFVANDSDAKIRAVNLLAALGADAVEGGPALKKYENDKDPELAGAVKNALAKIGPIPDAVMKAYAQPKPLPTLPVANPQIPRSTTPQNPNTPVKPPRPPDAPPVPNKGDNF